MRQVGATQMNERSSRSHTVLSLLLHFPSETDSKVILSSSLNCVDLAGSENAAATGAQGQRLREGSNINKSLLALSSVIRKLSRASNLPPQLQQQIHINFRDSKLTRMLQPALGGNSRLAVICCLSPASVCTEESTSTLTFAKNAKEVKNLVKINEVSLSFTPFAISYLIAAP